MLHYTYINYAVFPLEKVILIELFICLKVNSAEKMITAENVVFKT